MLNRPQAICHLLLTMALCALFLLSASSCKKPQDKRVETTAQTAQIREVPNLEFLYSPLIVCPSASSKGDLLLGKLNVNDERLSYYWFSPGNPLIDTGIDFEDVPNVPLLVLTDSSIIWGLKPIKLNALTGDILALQTKFDAPIDGSFSNKFPGLKDALLQKVCTGLVLYTAGSNKLVVEAKRVNSVAGRAEESDYFLLEVGKTPRKLDYPEDSIISHGYANDLSLVFFTEDGLAYRLNSDCTKFTLDRSLHVSGKVPSSSSIVLGTEYLWAITNSGVEGIPFCEGDTRVLLPVCDVPENAMESFKSMSSDNRYMAMHKLRKQWASKKGPNIVSSCSGLVLIGGRAYLIDNRFHRVLELEGHSSSRINEDEK